LILFNYRYLLESGTIRFRKN